VFVLGEHEGDGPMDKKKRFEPPVPYGSELLKIIEAGMDGDRDKIIENTRLLASKLPQHHYMRYAIDDIVTGDEKFYEMSKYDLMDEIAKDFDNHVFHGSNCGTCEDIFDIIIGWAIHHARANDKPLEDYF